jgi:glycosyltransferase involved in cell wall biosynthesis
MKRVCFAGAYDPGYPRNRILREGVRRAGWGVLEARVAEKRAWRRYPALAWSLARNSPGADVLLVPEFRHKDMPLVSALRGRRPVVFDPLVSRWDTLVGDWRIHAHSSGQARWNRMLDRWSLSSAQMVLCDTWAHGELLAELGAPREQLRRVLVGAEDEFFRLTTEPPAPSATSGGIRILYIGGFLPLHGVRTILEAARILESRAAQLPPFTFQLVGRGIEYDESRVYASWHKLERVEFTGKLDYSGAPQVFASAHIALGAFGAGAKTGRVIPHKLYQGLAAGRAVVTGDGPGVREVFTDGEQLLLVPRGNAEALAAALTRLIGDADLRARLGAAARARALEVATPDAVGRTLAAALAELVPGGGA